MAPVKLCFSPVALVADLAKLDTRAACSGLSAFRAVERPPDVMVPARIDSESEREHVGQVHRGSPGGHALDGHGRQCSADLGEGQPGLVRERQHVPDRGRQVLHVHLAGGDRGDELVGHLSRVRAREAVVLQRRRDGIGDGGHLCVPDGGPLGTRLQHVEALCTAEAGRLDQEHAARQRLRRLADLHRHVQDALRDHPDVLLGLAGPSHELGHGLLEVARHLDRDDGGAGQAEHGVLAELLDVGQALGGVPCVVLHVGQRHAGIAGRSLHVREPRLGLSGPTAGHATQGGVGLRRAGLEGIQLALGCLHLLDERGDVGPELGHDRRQYLTSHARKSFR